MPKYNLHLISLKAESSIPSFLSSLRKASIEPIFQGRAERWIILPHKLSVNKFLSRNTHWDLLILLHDNETVSQDVKRQIDEMWSARCGIPERFIKDYKTRNAKIMRTKTPSIDLPPPRDAKSRKYTSTSPVTLGGTPEFSIDLSSWLAEQPKDKQDHPVTMLNLLSFLPGKREQYNKYGEAFSKSVGNRHGGLVKINGYVIEGQGDVAQGQREGWDEMVLVHYPTLKNFIAMGEDEDYQKANVTYRVGALEDTLILCVMEIDDQGKLLGSNQAKL